MWAPPNEGAPGGSGDFQDDTSQGLQEEYGGFGDGDFNDESQPGGEITLEDEDPLANLFTPDEPDPNNPPSGESEDDDGLPALPTQEELTQELTTSIGNLAIPEDIFPEDYDQNDPRSQRELFTNIAKFTMQHTIKAMFKPVQVALQQQQRGLNRAIRDSIQGNNSAQQEAQIIESVIPAVRDPGLAPMVKTLYEAAKAKHKDPKLAAQAARRGLEAAGINPNGRPRVVRKDQKNPLDDYARLPDLPNPTPRPGQRAQSMLRR